MSHLSTSVETTAQAAQDLTTELADAVARKGWGVGTAESLTGGTIASVLSAAPDASTWFRGAVVAYTPQVKFDVLGVRPGPVVTEDCARTMATSAARLLGADLCVSVTGVGGPEDDEGQPAGTVWFAVAGPAGVRALKEVFEGSPPDVLAATAERALELLREAALE
jgi:nicotinamide-nucleotide amidase